MTTKTIEDALISISQLFDVPVTLSDPDLPDAPVIFANRRFEKQTGFTKQDTLNATSRYSKYLNDGKKNVATRLIDACARSTKHSCCLRMTRKDETSYTALVTIEPIFATDAKTYLLSSEYLFDTTTTRKQTQYHAHYLNVLLRTMYRATQSSQRLLADADFMRQDSIDARAESAFFLIQAFTTQFRTQEAIEKSSHILAQTRGVSKSTRRKFV